MRSLMVAAKLFVVTGLGVVVLVGCEGREGDGPVPSPSLSTGSPASGTVAPSEADALDELLALCHENIVPSAELAANAARRSTGVADPHGAQTGETSEQETEGSTGEAARSDARRAARTAADAVSACLQRTAELAGAADATPDGRFALVRSRLRDLSRSLGVLEQALQQRRAADEPVRDLTAALEGWRRLTAG